MCGVPSNVLELRYWFPLSSLSLGSVIGKPNVLRVHGLATKGGDEDEENRNAMSFRFAVQSDSEVSAWKSAFRDAFRGRYSERLGYLEKKRKREQMKRNMSRQSFASSKSSIVSGSTVSTTGFGTWCSSAKRENISFLSFTYSEDH